LGPISSAVLTFIGYKQTKKQSFRQAKYLNAEERKWWRKKKRVKNKWMTGKKKLNGRQERKKLNGRQERKKMNGRQERNKETNFQTSKVFICRGKKVVAKKEEGKKMNG